MYYLRTRDGLEIDLLIELENKLYLIEVKSSATIKPEHVSSLKRAKKDFGSLAEKTLIISNSKESFLLSQGVSNLSYREILLR